MVFALPFPDIGPDLIAIELFGTTFALRYYALAYIVGIALGWWIARSALNRPALWRNEAPPMHSGQLEDFVTWLVLGIILGGRLGFVLFYQPEYYLSNPVEILYIWQGGMSFHGGFMGVAVAALLFCRRNGIPLLPTADMLAVATPFGLMLGRIANFINGELWGRPTDLPWGVIFPGIAAQDCAGVIGLCARHPSQLYQAGLEGLLLALVLLWLVFRGRALRRPGMVTGVFLAGYGLARFTVEFFRQADEQFITADNPLGHVIRLGEAGVTMGQILSLPMLLAGLALILLARRRT